MLYSGITKKVFFYILCLLVLFISCEESPDGLELENPILKKHFTFHQEENELFFAIETKETYAGIEIKSVSVLWYGTDNNNSPDSIILYDNGLKGDILKNDNIYSKKIPNSALIIENTLGNDSGRVYVQFRASYGDSIASVVDSFKIGNLMPKIMSVIFPDSMLHPTEENYYAIDSIFVNVFDPNGLDDIRSCYLIFQKPDGSYANNGDPIYLFDDGNKSDDNISIWARAANDGIFSRLITIGYENPLGKYYANFYVNDWSGLFTSLIDSVIVYE